MVKSSSLMLMATALAFTAAPVSAQLSLPLDSATLAGFPWREIGPVNMGGRVTDIRGKSLDFASGPRMLGNRGVVVSNGAIHEGVLRELGRWWG